MSGEPIRPVDPGQLRALLRTYLRLSVREAILLRTRGGGPSSFAIVLLMYGLGGLMIGLAAFLHPDVFLFSVGVHAMTFFAVGMAAVIEANEVLFDRREEEVLFPLPVHPSTLLLAKSLALIAFASLIAFALNFFPTFLGLAATDAQPWFPLVHILSVLLLTTFVCAAVVCVYGLVLRLFGRDRFENLAVWAQVGMVAMYVGGFQILPRLLQGRTTGGLAEIARWLRPVPPGWFASIDAWLAGRSSGTDAIPFALVGVVATAILGWLAVARLSAGYGEAAVPASGVPAAARTSGRVASGPWRSRNPVLRWWLRDPIEWGAFRLATAYIRRDREIKLRVYTSLTMFVLLVVLSILDARRERATFLPLVMLAYSSTGVLSAIEALESSSQFAAAEIFASTPLESAAPLFHGVRKACILLVQAPLLLASFVLLVLFRSQRLDYLDLAAPIVVLIPTLTLIPAAITSYVPLSKAPRRGEQSSRRAVLLILTMVGMMGVLVLGYGASSLGLLWVLVLIELVAVVFVHAWLLRRIRERPFPRMLDG